MSNELKNGISFTKAYATSDGKTFTNLTEAQKHSLGFLLNVDADAVLQALVDNREAVINILSTTDKSRPKARKANGATRKPRNSATISTT